MEDHDPTASNGSRLVGEVSAIIQRLPKYAKLSWLLLRDPVLSARHRAVLTAALGYSISPIDAVPGIIPVIGQMDDLAVVLLALLWILRSLPAERAESYLSQCGLAMETVEADLDVVKRNGLKLLKRAKLEIAVGAAFVLGVGKFAGREILRGLKERRRSEESEEQRE